jgi:anhydro-N-acetylmuramic acid kinase
MREDQPIAIGMMCGSSLDGIDVAWVRGADLLHLSTAPLPGSLQTRLQSLLADEPLAPHEIAALEVATALAFVDAVRRSGYRGHADFIACHGITVAHDPARGYSWQLGALATVARGLRTTVVGHFRSHDVAAGGEGAPLAPLFHQDLFGWSLEDRLVLNLGGIANLSELPATGSLRGYDLGPCNLLLDPLYRRLTGSAGFDSDGDFAARGRACDELLPAFLDHPFLRATPPKSTGREAFGPPFVDSFAAATDAAGCSHTDALRTAVRYVAANVADHVRRAAHGDWRRLILCGGGSHNRALVEEIRTAVSPLPVESARHHNDDPDAVEAVGFALLGAACLRGTAQSIAAITGGPGEAILGQIQPGPGYVDLLTRLAASESRE